MMWTEILLQRIGRSCTRKHQACKEMSASNPIRQVTPSHLLQVKGWFGTFRSGLGPKHIEILQSLCASEEAAVTFPAEVH